MKTKSRTVIHTLFPHTDDPAYQKLAELEERVSTVKARRGTAPFKQRLQRAIVRISEYLVDYSNDGDEPGREAVMLRAVGDCRKAASAIEMMFRGGAFSRDAAAVLLDIVGDIAQLLIDRVYELRGAPSVPALARPVLREKLTETMNDAPRADAPRSVVETPDRILDG